jgi:hypothetical protein
MITRTVQALVIGYVVIVVCITLATLAAARLLLGPGAMDPSAPLTPLYLSVNVLYSFAFAALGGYVTAAIAPRAPAGHAVVLGIIMMVLGLASARTAVPGQPSWYLPLISIGGGACAALGGWFRASQIRRARDARRGAVTPQSSVTRAPQAE